MTSTSLGSSAAGAPTPSGPSPSLWSFPNPVNEVAARTVAAGVVVMALGIAVAGWGWLLVPLTYGFWARVLQQNPNVNPRSRRFIDGWLDLLATVDPTDLAGLEAARTFIARREEEHKRAQARLKNQRLLQAWLGSAGSNPLIYRWPQVRPVLQDLHDGLERADA